MEDYSPSDLKIQQRSTIKLDSPDELEEDQQPVVSPEPKQLQGMGGDGRSKIIESHNHDHHHHEAEGHDHGHSHHHHEENINIRAAVVHVIGDMLQSIGVIIAAAAIKVWGEKVQIVDPICTYIFSVLVIFTTVPVFKDCIKVLMESQPNGVDGTAIKA